MPVSRKEGTSPRYHGPMKSLGRCRRLLFLALAALLSFPCTSIASERANQSFDGKWDTTLNCTPFQDAQGFTWHFVSEVKGAHFLGHYGTEGQPASLKIEGDIGDDGTGTFHASGRTGLPQYAIGNPQRGSNVSYDIRVDFHESHGKGTRLEGRPCTYQFDRQ
jgi:hypothetical protein